MPALSAVLIGRVSPVGFSQPALQQWTTFFRHALDGLKFETPETAGRDLNCHQSTLSGEVMQQAPIRLSTRVAAGCSGPDSPLKSVAALPQS
jgi:hypothetical protein